MARVAVIDRELCKPEKCKYRCKKVCPKNRAGIECITIDEETKFPVINEEVCIGCGLCINACDKAGFKAISIVNLPEQLKETPVHRFGPNQFVLYRLPFPTSGEVVGLVGPNGAGKTTALNILSGKLKPNFGKFEKEVDISELIKIFRGTELQPYFEKLKNKEIKTSIKPQRIDQIPLLYKDKISKLLEKTDERKILNSIIKIFDLEKILDKKIDEISGGELQRVAIAACIAKDADIYYLDEPTSFLDVEQRLLMARAVRELCRNKSVMVADHDLATLDFFSDKIHIFYGFPAVYGIVSKPYGVRVGINTFLEGYIKEDNVRIRPEPITFFTDLAEKEVPPEILISFKNLEKKFKRFKLEIDSGDIRKKEVLACLGANALGKTTFAKILAGEIEKDKGEINNRIKISYKPQYIRSDFKGTVRKLLSSIAEIESKIYWAEIIRPLGLRKILDKNIQDLSGGELQRVTIASCLSKQADLYLLDEPSAFLDVEQRFGVAKMINKIVESREKSALIIDHDLLFLSKIGARAMVFLGEPGIKGHAKTASIRDVFNDFLKEVGVTFRQDKRTGRPRANKPESKLDREQKEKGKYFYL
jgi:ATP-binding cassette subfamily E protein 1